jgi:hypothetical protein
MRVCSAKVLWGHASVMPSKTRSDGKIRRPARASAAAGVSVGGVPS